MAQEGVREQIDNVVFDPLKKGDPMTTRKDLGLPPRPRGARPTPRYKLAGATPHKIRGRTPPQFAIIPSQLSYWLNDKYGDCVTAEEAFAKACYSPEIFIQDATVQTWATANGVLNGAYLLQVIEMMESNGFQQDGYTYNDGTATSIDWTDAPTLQNAISQGPVKIGVAADQLENVVPINPPSNGWFATGFTSDQNEDHCVSLCGYGTISWLAQQLGVSVPSGVDGTQPGYLLFTWDTIGIIDVPSMLAITSEAWLRTPTTIILGTTPASPPQSQPGSTSRQGQQPTSVAQARPATGASSSSSQSGQQPTSVVQARPATGASSSSSQGNQQSRVVVQARAVGTL